MISFTPQFLVLFQLLWDTPVPFTLQCCGFWSGACQRSRGQSKVYQTCQSKLPVCLWLLICLTIHVSLFCLMSICLFFCLMSICLIVCLFVWLSICLFVVSCLFLCNFYVVRSTCMLIKLNGFPKKVNNWLLSCCWIDLLLVYRLWMHRSYFILDWERESTEHFWYHRPET